MMKASIRQDNCALFLQRNTGYLRLAMSLSFVLCSAVMPHLGWAQVAGGMDLCSKANSALTWIKEGVFFILVVAVLGSGVMAAFGRMSWATVGQVLIGSILAGLATEVVTALFGSGGC
jgi:type IV secretory pathway VirB2 component (pilin)